MEKPSISKLFGITVESQTAWKDNPEITVNIIRSVEGGYPITLKSMPFGEFLERYGEK